MTTITDLTTPIVQTRADWNAAWATVDHLRPVDASLAVAPTVDAATFEYVYGRICRPGSATFAAVTPLASQLGNYVRICIPGDPDPTPIWVGQFADQADAPGAVDAAAGGTGRQVLTAFGLVRMLQAAAVDGAYGYIDSSVQHIDTPLPFNLRNPAGPTLLGNRSTSKQGASYVFSADGALWTGRDVVEYLLARFVETDATLPAFSLLAGNEANNLDNLFGPWPAPPNVAAGLAMIMDRRRGHAWRVTCYGDNPLVECRSIFETNISAGGATIYGAQTTIDLTPDTAGELLDDVRIRYAAAHQYDEIQAVGEPLWVCGSAPLSAAWTATEEAAYLAADDDARGLDVHRAVFADFRIPVTASKLFDLAIYGCPLVNTDGSLDTDETAPLFQPGHTITRQTPLRVGYTYTTGSEALTDSGATPPPAFLPPIVYGQATVPDVGTVYGSLTGPVNSFRKIGAPPVSVRPAAGELGLRIEANPAHILADGHFTGATSTAAQPVFDWEDLIATFAIRADNRLKVTERIASPGDPAPRVLVIDVPDAECWIIAPGTILGVDASGHVTTADWITTRNDYLRLDVVAKIAAAWYGRTRAAISCAWRQIVSDFKPGDMVDNIILATVSTSVGTIISRVSWNFADATTSLETDFAELDFAGVASGYAGTGAPTLPSARELYDAARTAATPAPPPLTAAEGSVRQISGTGDNITELFDLIRATG